MHKSGAETHSYSPIGEEGLAFRVLDGTKYFPFPFQEKPGSLNVSPLSSIGQANPLL